ncbi:TlpA disulfide reductase family protein [Chloroflexus sp. MS-CIW-1]|jgi:thiol-disulfide isomerase/thioredoxin|uniref:TlpA family protein disulfide reductase n=1 Tax=unclassified Chloroflexus TaxID=2633855 RepID=UPI0004DF3A06|nr:MULTISPECIES: TlpA disulfide reductase family protein [unclassified Chloroflexus]MDN5273081.1 TlpA disulfide reductase family protein [Chloroflexus sp. MS-CIW-1]
MLTGIRREWLIATLIMSGVSWILISRPPDNHTMSVSPRAGFIAPAIVLPQLDGELVSLDAFKGQVVIVNFWASWCGPCRAEMPTLERLYQIEQTRGLTVLAVNSTFQDDQTNVAQMRRDLGLSFPILLDYEGTVGHRYGVRMLPTTFIIDRQGVIRQVLFGGPLSEASLRNAVEPLLREE